MTIGTKIKTLRTQHSLTQEKLAAALGVSAQSISKWETGLTMPDITLLPAIAEAFGVSIDDLFDLTVEQRMNRLESRLDLVEELSHNEYVEYDAYLQGLLSDQDNRNRATSLLAYLHWHRMYAEAQKVRRYAKDAIRLQPAEKYCQWMLNMAEGHCVWDWNLAHHNKAIDFYRELVDEHPEMPMLYYYLIDNLLADHRADDAEYYLERLCQTTGYNPVLPTTYRAYIALARFDVATADAIMRDLAGQNTEDALFEAAQYHARKCDYDVAIDYYERAFAVSQRRPRYSDELMGIAEIYRIQGNYRMAAATYDRMVELLTTEWGMTEDTELVNTKKLRDDLLAKANGEPH